jgi:hypothetical protein
MTKEMRKKVIAISDFYVFSFISPNEIGNVREESEVVAGTSTWV